MSTTVNYSGAERKLQAIITVLHRPMRDVLDSAARVMATQMARSAQPFGTGADALQKGKAAVARDILKVYWTPSRAFTSIPETRKAKAFWAAYSNRDYDGAQAILAESASPVTDVPLEQFDDGEAHKANRERRSGGGRGMVHLSRPVMIVTNPRALAKYIESVQRNVGFGKGGFADIARALGAAPRGLKEDGDITASWITHHKGFGKAYHGGTDTEPTIRILNTVGYASEILNGSALTQAKEIAHHRMIENLTTAVKAELKKLRAAA
jgi:hypothetical protein